MSSALRIIVDENMPMAEAFFGRLGDVRLKAGRTITRDDVRHADVLLVRSVTRVNRELLEGSSVRFVGSATIGTDHVDLAWLAAAGIQFAHAPGCNAQAVVEYVIAALAYLAKEKRCAWGADRIGIVGGGHVGSRLARTLVALGWSVQVFDPFLNSAESDLPLATLEQIQGCDIVSIHTPLTHDGDHPTAGMIDHEWLSAYKGRVLINAGRGPVIDEAAICPWIEADSSRSLVLDVWPNEPTISQRLMECTTLGSPHIAGYSLEGRIQGTRQVHQALCSWLRYSADEPPLHLEKSASQRLDDLTQWDVDPLLQWWLTRYDPTLDDAELRDLALSGRLNAGEFDRLRKFYRVRRQLIWEKP